MNQPFFKTFHASYNPREKGFVCLICEKSGFKSWIFECWEIPRHLKSGHNISRKEQVISGWNGFFESEYLRNRKKNQSFDSDVIVIDNTESKDIQRDRRRIEEERKFLRDSW